MTSPANERRLQARLADHQAAVQEFLHRAQALDGTQWLTPRAEGKWTPAQEARHVILAYQAFQRQMEGGAPMPLRASPVRRRIARWIGLTSILYRKRIPVAVRAPREARPEWETTPPEELLALLRSTTDTFDATFADRWRQAPATRLTHYLFGALTLDQGIQLMTVHTRHHAAFLPRIIHVRPS